MSTPWSSASIVPLIVVALAIGTPRVAASEEQPDRITNGLGMTLAPIPAGSFSMGQQEDGDWDERPAHPVQITKPFYMATTEVTNAQYEQFDPDHRALRGSVSRISGDDDEAVVYVSWHDAMRFCDWLSEKEGKPYRLPTEAEWEYACRAGTTTPYHTGGELPESCLREQKTSEKPRPVKLHVGQTPPNAWGLHDMHGNVEEWCHDWYGPYGEGEERDPVGYADGDFKVTRGGSHNTETFFLRSANRMATLPEDKHWLIGFRVVMAALPETAPRPQAGPGAWGQTVSQSRHDWKDGPDPDIPYFKGSRVYVKIPPGSDGPMYSHHNHCPGLTACPNGDLFAIWYSTRREPGRELAIVASRLRLGSDEWVPAAPFWDAADRNDHASALLWDGKETLFHLNGLGTDGTWDKLALIVRTSTDNGATWSKARIANPNHGRRNMPIAGVFMTKDGAFVLPCDAVTGGEGGSVVHVSFDGGKTWEERSGGAPRPNFTAGNTGPRIAGIHAGVVELADGRLMALGRGDSINGRMPMSISNDLGKSWTYSASDFPPIGGGQRIALRRLAEGPLFLASFTPGMQIADASGAEREVRGLFAALSFDDGETWPVKKLITDGKASREMDGGGNTHEFTMGPNSGEPRGYLAAIQTPNRIIHLISSRLHYEFNLAWLRTPAPAV